MTIDLSVQSKLLSISLFCVNLGHLRGTMNNMSLFIQTYSVEYLNAIS